MIPVDIGNTPQVNHAVGEEGFPAGVDPVVAVISIRCLAFHHIRKRTQSQTQRRLKHG
jgi:hypothetical protein